MLVLTRKIGEQLMIRVGDETVAVRVLDVNRGRALLGIEAPRSVPVHREEVARRLQDLQEDLDELRADGADRPARTN